MAGLRVVDLLQVDLTAAGQERCAHQLSFELFIAPVEQ
jgi:hypothetical protein